MKKTIIFILCAVMMMSLFAGCGSDSKAGENGTVNVYNWGLFIDEDLIDQFEEDTGISVNYKTFQSNEQMYSVIKQGGVDYDVIVPSDYMVSRMIDEGMLEEINFDNVPNYAGIDDSLKGMDFDPEERYCVPYMWGTVGIIYDPARVGEVDSWSVLFDEKYEGDILMFDNSRDAMGIALKYLGYSLNTSDEKELNEAFELLKKQKPILQSYVMDKIFDKLEAGEAGAGPYYAGDYLTMVENNPNLKFCIPKEGSNVFVDAMCIPKGASNKENAEIFINYMASAEASKINSEFIGYTSPVASVKDGLDLDENSMNVKYPPKEILDKCESFVNLPQDTLDFYDSMWVKLKS